MEMITALAVVIGVLAAVATYLCLGTSLGLLVWALSIGWGCFFATGGKETGLKNSAINHIWGALVAAIALVVIGHAGGGVGLNSVIVGVSVVILVIAAKMPMLSTIPAGVYGYAATAAAVLMTANVLGGDNAVFKTALLVVVSMILGNIFGYVSEKIASSLAKA